MNIKQFVFNPLGVNCYILSNRSIIIYLDIHNIVVFSTICDIVGISIHDCMI